MSIVPEFILQATIVRGIKRMRGDTRLIDQLFRNLDQKGVDQVRTFIKEQPFDLCINYPRTTLKVPAIVILLKGESENQAFLGDSMGLGEPDEFSFDGGIDGEILGGAASLSNLSGNPTVVFGPFRAYTGTENTLRILTREWQAAQFETSLHHIRIVAGTGVGQVRKVSTNSMNIIMVEPAWLTIPDSTSVFEVTKPPEEVLGEPSSLYDRRAVGRDPIERKGGLYDMNYQIQVIGPNPELTICMSIILKAIFTAFRIFLEGQGVIDMKMGASDFTPRPEYQPDLSYLRALNLGFIFHFDTFERLEVAHEIRLVLESAAPPESIEAPLILSDTSFDLDNNPQIGGSVVSNSLSDTQRIYFGAETPPMVIDATWIQNTLALQGTLITGTRKRAINYIAGPGQKTYYVIPGRFGGQPADFVDAGSGLPVGVSIVASLDLTTSFGTEAFNVFESNNAGLGAFTTVVN